MRKYRCWEVVELIEQKTPNVVFIIQLRVKKICKTENISVAKFLYKKPKRWFERNGAKIFSQRLNWPAKVC